MAAEDPGARQLGLLVLLLQETDGVNGRTRLQKMTYLLNLIWNCFDFGFHYYGPFSQDLMGEMEILRDSEFVKETVTYTGSGRAFYSYRLSDRGAERADTIITNTASEELVRITREFIEELEAFSSNDLEIMASLAYLRQVDQEEDDEDLIKDLRELKPYFTLDEIRRGLQVFDILEGHGIERAGA